MSSAIANAPTSDSLIELDSRDPERRNPFYMAKAWIIWITQSLIPRVESSTEVLLVNKEYTDQHVSLPTTILPTGSLPAGVYLVSYTLRVTTADGVSSSVQVSLGWTDNGGPALTLNAAALAADSVTLPQTGQIRPTIGPNTSLTFTTVYASNTPNKMRYKLQFSVVRVGSI